MKRNSDPVMYTDSNLGPQASTMGPSSLGRFTFTESLLIDCTAAHVIWPRFGRQSVANDRRVDSFDRDPASKRSK